MALTELQIPTKDNFYAKLKNAATQMNNLMSTWTEMAELLEMMGTADLDAMGVAAGQVRIDIVDFRILMQEVVAFYDGTSTAQTNVPETVVNKIRSL